MIPHFWSQLDSRLHKEPGSGINSVPLPSLINEWLDFKPKYICGCDPYEKPKTMKTTKYKLIKAYPGSPVVGAEFEVRPEQCGSLTKKYYRPGDPNYPATVIAHDVIDNPDFWEKQEEADFLSVKVGDQTVKVYAKVSDVVKAIRGTNTPAPIYLISHRYSGLI